MTFEDDTRLSAYLDGELDDPLDRASIESALTLASAPDPDLAEQLQSLSAVHDLVSSLLRPAPPADLSGLVLARIARETRKRRFQSLFGVLALAASLLLAVGVGRNGIPPRRPAAVGRHAGDAFLARSTAPSRLPARRLEDRPLNEDERLAETNAPAKPALARTEEQRIRSLLEDHRLRRVLVLTDRIGGVETVDQVEDLVRQTPRADETFGRITISHGIVIDPKHPNEATVFALVMNENELREFEQKLAKSFPRQIEENEPPAEIVNHLARVGQISVAPSQADLLGLLTRSDKDKAPRSEPAPAPGALLPLKKSVGRSLLAARREEQPSVVLVWVTRP